MQFAFKGSSQSCTVCPGTIQVSGNVITYLSYPCPPPNVCLTTGNYTGSVSWGNPSSSGSTGTVDNIYVDVQSGGVAIITFPAGTVIGNLTDPMGWSYTQLLKKDAPYSGTEFVFDIQYGDLAGAQAACNCTFPITITNESISSLSSPCKVTFTATGSNASLMKDMFLMRSLDGVSFMSVARQDISYVNNGVPVGLSISDDYPKGNSQNKAYYKLRFVDLNGKISYSSTKLVTLACQSPSNGVSDCSNVSLVGSDTICGSNTMGYVQLSNLPNYTAVQWSYTPADNSIATISVKDVDRIIVHRQGAGNFVVSAYLPGCNKTLTKNIQVTSIPLAKLTNTSTNQSSTLSLNTSVTAGNYRIDLNCPTCTNVTWTGSRPLSPTTGNQTNFSLVSGNAWVRATGNNACGPFTRTYNFYVRSGYGFTVTPNPSGGLTTLAADAGTSIKEVRVFDQIGREYFKKVYPNGVDRAQIDLSSLKGGFYLIQINNGKESKVQQLVIKK